MEKSSFGDRMKRFELSGESYLVPRMPVMIRIDGKAFSKFTKGLRKPMDEDLRLCMEYTAFELVKKIDGCRFAYTQSDEITLLLVDYGSRDTQAWFNNRVSKILSIAASLATGAFIKAALNYLPEHLAKKGFPAFDARAWNIPQEEVCNAFLWRQQDATRNAIQGLGQANFSHRDLQNKSCNDIQEMLFTEKGINFNDEPTYYKRGFSLYKSNCFVEGSNGDWVERKKVISDLDMPIISQDRFHVENWLAADPVYDIENTNAYILDEIKFSSFSASMDG